MTNNLLKKLMASTVIVFAVGVGGVWAEKVKSNLPTCEGKNVSKWNNCFGTQNIHGGNYEGEYKQGKQHGFGVYKNAYGEVYTGEWKNDERDGYGLQNYANGDKYLGNWLNGYRTNGIFTYADGSIIKGIWKKTKLIKEEKLVTSQNKDDEQLFENFPSELTEIKNLNIQFAIKNTQSIIPPSLKSDSLKIQYPALSKRLGEQGIVKLKILINENGKVGIIELLKSSGYAKLDEAALTGVKLMDFFPAMSNGNPISSWEEFSIPFVLK